MTVEPGPVTCLVTEFPAWQVSLRPAGLAVCSAYWQSDDGRHRRIIVAATPGELLERLRAAERDSACTGWP